jgi:CrcB protein
MSKWVYLVAGSILGGIARYILAGAVYEKMGTSFPYGTLIVNLSGCFLIGFFSSLVDDKFFLGPNSRILLMTGFCGAYTTFSTYMFETGNLVKEGQVSMAFLNILVSTVVGFGAYWLGVIIGDII